MPLQGNTRAAPSQPPPPPRPLGAEPGWGVLEDTPVGPLWMAWGRAGLTLLQLGRQAPDARELARWHPELDLSRRRVIPDPVYGGLRRFFDGESQDPATLPVQIGGTPFQRAVYEALRRVPRGQVRTYAGLARDAGSPRAGRAVGAAMAANPLAIVVPCHRVVGAGLTLGGYSGGLDRKRALLRLEGVRVEGDRVRPGQLGLLWV